MLRILAAYLLIASVLTVGLFINSRLGAAIGWNAFATIVVIGGILTVLITFLIRLINKK